MLLTTQYMEEAEQLANELTVIDKGKIIARGGVDELKAKVGGRTLQLRPSDPAQLAAMAQAIREAGLDGVAGAQAVPDEGLLYVPILSDEQLTSVIGLLGTRGFPLAHVATALPSLDEVFLAITGEKSASATDTIPEEVAA